MVYLLLILLFFGFLQSLFELKGDDTIIFKWNIKKFLSILYIIGFIFGFVVIIIQNGESNRFNILVQNISTSLQSVDSISKEQLKYINESLEQTKSITGKSDSINRDLMKVLAINESLISQYHIVNKRLAKQIELETRQLKERAPIINFSDNNIHLEINDDSTVYWLKACINNLGKRNALINNCRGYILFINKKNQPFKYVEIRGNSEKYALAPIELRNETQCYYSFAISDFNKTKIESSFAVICLRIDYTDLAIDKDSVVFQHCGWYPSVKNFGGLKDWQYGIAKKWVRENLNFYKK